MIRDAADWEGEGCWVRRLLWIVGRGGEEEHTTRPNDLYSPSRVGRGRECPQGFNPRPKDYRVDEQVDVLFVVTALVRGIMKADGYRKLAIEEKGSVHVILGLRQTAYEDGPNERAGEITCEAREQ
jgi:hypothetical protein